MARILQRLPSPGNTVARGSTRSGGTRTRLRDSMSVSRMDVWPGRKIARHTAHGRSEIAKAGDYFVQEVAGESLIIVRDKGGKWLAFYNVCRHRGTRLREDRPGQAAPGHVSAIQCPYHAWTYGLDGRLLGTPHMDEVRSPKPGTISSRKSPVKVLSL